MWVTGTAPSGWLICDGTEKAVADYGTLAGVLSTTYGALTNGSGGVGTTHFRLPDLRGRVPMGAGTGRNVADSANLTARTLGAKISDAETHTLTSAEIPGHTHPVSITDPGHAHTIDPSQVFTALAANWGASYGAPEIAYRQDYGQTIFSNTTGITASATSNTGGGGAHNNVQPSTVINFIIKF
jgi:microcystin-dependent protein